MFILIQQTRFDVNQSQIPIRNKINNTFLQNIFELFRILVLFYKPMLKSDLLDPVVANFVQKAFDIISVSQYLTQNQEN